MAEDIDKLTGLPTDITDTNPDPNAGDELDKALLAATGGVVPEGVKIDPKIEEDATAKAAEEAARVEAAAKADEAKQKEEDAKRAAATAQPTPEEIEAKRVADEAAAKAAKETFETVVLPPYAKPATTEAFSKVKSLAAAQIEAAKKGIADRDAKLKEYEEKVKLVGKLPENVEKELSELREFRAKLDVEADPKFKEWDTKVAENIESIYAKLKAVGTTDVVIAKIKEMGGPAELDWDSMTDKMPSTAKRYIEGKLFENEDLIEKKTKALNEAKSKAQEYVQTRAAAFGTDVAKRIKDVDAKVKELSPKVAYVSDKVAPAGAKPEEIAAVEAHNKRAADIRATMAEAINDDSPQMKSLLVLGIAQLQHVQTDFEAFKVTAAAEKAALERELGETKTLLEKIKKAGKSRIGAAPAPGEVTTVPKVNYAEDGGEALDRLAKEAQAKAQRD